MDIIDFVLLLSGIAICALCLALYVHHRKVSQRRYFTDPKRDHVYRHYTRKGKAVKNHSEQNQPFEL